MWKDCPVASDEVLKIPQNNRPMCPYEAQQFEAALGAVEERMGNIPGHDALGGQFGEHVALLQVMVTRAAHALSACGFTDVVKTQKDEIGASTSQVKLPSALQAFMRLSTEYRRCVKMIEVPREGISHHEGHEDHEGKKGEMERKWKKGKNRAPMHSGDVAELGTDRNTLSGSCTGRTREEEKEEKKKVQEKAGMNTAAHGLAGTETDGGGEAPDALLAVDACPGENGSESGGCSGLNGKGGEQKDNGVVLTKLKDLGRLEAESIAGGNVIDMHGMGTTGEHERA
jgi:hypothetical protein